MIRSGITLKVFYPKLTTLRMDDPCTHHGLHRVSEAIRDKFPKVDVLISNTKKIFLKTLVRVNLLY